LTICVAIHIPPPRQRTLNADHPQMTPAERLPSVAPPRYQRGSILARRPRRQSPRNLGLRAPRFGAVHRLDREDKVAKLVARRPSQRSNTRPGRVEALAGCVRVTSQ
jgi:hypothetical protein